MTTTELAAKYGVPMPETSRQLQWDGETHLRWSNDGILCIAERDTRFVLRSLDKSIVIANTTFWYGTPAPQFHEIWDKLPKNLEYNHRSCVLKITNNCIYYANFIVDPEPIVYIQNNNIAQAAAEMYLMLKKDGKL